MKFEITVNRSAALPVFITHEIRLVHPRLQMFGPRKYDVRSLISYRHPSRDKGIGEGLNGDKFHRHLKARGLLKRSLSLDDLVRLSRLDVSVFERVFKHRTRIHAWRSVGFYSKRERFVLPYLYLEDTSRNTLSWAFPGGPLGKYFKILWDDTLDLRPSPDSILFPE